MKKLLYFIILSVITNSAYAQTVTSSCTAPDFVVRQYADDADFMAAQHIVNTGNKYKDSITIPQDVADTPQRAMIAVYNALTLPARDSVVMLYPVHDYRNFTPHYIFINADSNEVYMKQLKQNIFPTGDVNFDNLAATYTMKSFQYLPFGTGPIHSLTIELDSTYNVPILAKLYKSTLTGVQTAAGTYIVQGDSSQVHYTITPNYVKLDYERRWDSCAFQGGCHKSHTWTFHVSYNCDVSYIGSSGDPINPGPKPNSISNIATQTAHIYPNPVTDKLNIQGISTNHTYTIYNLQGAKLATGTTNKQVDVTTLPTGNYLLRLDNGTNTISLQFQKQ